MRKIAFFVFKEDPMCFIHVLLNSLDLKKKGHDVKVIFEGPGVKVPSKMGDNKMYQEALAAGLFEGVCEACSKALGVYEENKETGLKFLSDLNGHPAFSDYIDQGYEIITM